MTTEFLMKVDIIFKDDKKDKRIVGGANSKYPIEDLSWLNFIDKDVMIKTKSGDFLFTVKKIDIFTSISGLLNIGLTLYDNTNFNHLNIGDKVYKIT